MPLSTPTYYIRYQTHHRQEVRRPRASKGLEILGLSYTVVNKGGKPYVELEVKPGVIKLFSPEEISAMVMKEMKETAESYLRKPVAGAVITVPAYFNDSQRQATKDAGIIACLNVLRIVNEPTAAAIAYGDNNKTRKRKRSWKSKIFVYDLGGGTFDNGEFEVLAYSGNTHLGGGDFDQRLMGHFMKLIKRKYNKDIIGDIRAIAKLRKECKSAKRNLSNETQVKIEIEYFLDGKDFSEPLTRDKFEELNLDLFNKTLDVVKRTLKDAKVSKSEIDEIVLVGGSTRIPKLRQMLKDLFYGKEPNKAINPDEAVAYGAAVLGAGLSGKASYASKIDVTPLCLGVSVHGGLMSVVIPRNTPIPTKMSQNYTTIKSQQTSMLFKIFQGQRVLTNNCIELGSFSLRGIPPAPRGVPTAEVTFEIDENGILNVTAKDKFATANSESITMTDYKENLTREEIQRMIEDAQQMAEEDKTEKVRVEARNRLEEYINDVKTAIQGNNEWIGMNVERALKEASRWLDMYKNASVEEASKEDYEETMHKLAKVWNPFITNRYSK
ncbi:Heat shock 70 kDa protein BIP2 [Linum perenne]